MTSPLPGNVDIVRVRGYWFDQDGGGNSQTITFEPLVSNITDAAAFSYIKTETVVVTPNPVTAYFFHDLIASNDPDLTPFAWKVTLQGQPSITISVDYNASVVDVGGGVNMKAVWLTDAASISPPPPPIPSYYTSVQTNAAIAEALDGFEVTSAVTSVSGRTGDVVLVEGDVSGLVADLAAKTAKATLTTKGDLYVASAASTPARLGVGTNGQVLTADSSQTTGTKWSDPAPTGVASVTAGDATVTVAGTSADPTVAVNAIPESKVTGLVTDLAGKAATVHVHAGADITSGTVAIGRIPTGTTGSTVPFGNDARFTDARTPTAHHTTHNTGGTDAIAPSDIGAAAATHTHAESDVTSLVTDLAGKQPLDSDLTAVAALAPANDDVIQRKAGAWTNRTMAQLSSDLGLAAGYQPLDSDLTTIASLTAATDNVIQSVGSAWASRTPAQLKATLALAKADVGLGSVDNTSDATKNSATATLTNKTLTGPVINSPTGIVASDVGAQPVDTDLTTIAALAATTDNMIQSVGSAWASRTPAQVKAALVIAESDVTNLVTDLAAKQPLDADLTAIAGLTATTNNTIMSVGSAWASRTPTQVKAALAIAESDVANLVTDLAAKVPLSTVTTKGDIVAATASAAISRLGVGSNNQVLTADSSTATGLKWAAAASGSVSSVTAGDSSVTIGGTSTDPTVAVSAATLASLAPVASPTFTGTATFAKTVGTPVALTDAATIAVDASLGNLFRVTLGGNRTMGVPSTPSDGQRILFELIQDGTGSRTITWSSSTGGYAFDTPTPVLNTTAGARDFIAFVYNATANKWRFAPVNGGVTSIAAGDSTVTIGGTSSQPTVAVSAATLAGLVPTATVKDYGAVGNGTTDDTAAIQAAITAVISGDSAGALYFPAGTYKITSALVVPFATRWKMFGASRGTTIIKQFTNNTRIFRFTGDLTHSWSISSMTLTYNTGQTAANTNSYAIFFDAGNASNIYNFELSDLYFSNCYRCIGCNPALTQPAMWGMFLDRIDVASTVTGSLLTNASAGVIGCPNIVISRTFLDCAGQVEPAINLVAADNISLNDVEFNQGSYTGNQMSIITSNVVTLKNVKCETVTLVNGANLWDFAQSQVVAIGVKAFSVTASGTGASKILNGPSGGTLSVMGFEGSSTGNSTVPYSFTDIKFISDVQCAGTMVKNTRDILGDQSGIPRLNVDCLTSDATKTRGDVSVTLTATDYRVQYFNTTLTANRTVTLPSTGLVDGQEFKVVRYAGGAFTLSVSDPLGSKNYTIPASLNGFVTYRAVGTGEWLIVDAGVSGGTQPLDADLSTIAGLTATSDNFMVANASAWASRTPAQAKASLAITEADVSGLVSDLAAKQPLDSDLTTIASLTATTDNFMVAAGSAWASRTPAQAKTSLAITEADVSGLVADLAGKVSAANSTLTGVTTLADAVVRTPFALTDGATINTDASQGSIFRVTLAGNRTMAAPTNAVDGQEITYELVQDATGGRTITWTSGSGGFAFDTLSAPILTLTASKRDFVSFFYNSTAARWQYSAPPTSGWADRVETLTDGSSVSPNANNGFTQAGIWVCATATPTLFAPANGSQGQTYRVIVNASGAQRVITLSGFVASTDDPTSAVTVASGKWVSLLFEYISAVGWLYEGKKGN